MFFKCKWQIYVQNTKELTYSIFNKLINNKRFNEQYLLIQST